MKVKEESEKVGLKLNIQKTKIMASSPTTSWQIDGKQWQILFWGTPKSLQMVTTTMKLKDTPWEKSYDQPRQHIIKQRHYFANKGLTSQGYGFSNSHVWMWELDYKESWVPNNWCFWTVLLEKTLESPLDCKEIQSVHPKGSQSWIFIGRTDVEAETPILWLPDAKNWLIWKDPDAGRDWRWEENGMTEDEMVGWHHWLDGHEVFFFFPFIFICWRLITLQDCSGFCYTLTWISHGFTCIPHPDPCSQAWVWVSSGSWWWTGRPDVLQCIGSQRVRHDWATELNFHPCYHVHSGAATSISYLVNSTSFC